MTQATIDELQIEISADSTDAAQNIEKLQQALERLQAPVQALTNNGGLNKLSKQLNKLAEAARAAANLTGFEKIAQAANSLGALRNIQDISLTRLVNGLQSLAPAIGSLNSMPQIDTARLQQLDTAMTSLSQSANAAEQITRLTTALGRLPNIAKKINSTNFAQFSYSIQQVTTALSPLIERVERAAEGLTALAQILRSVNQQAGNTGGGVNELNSTLGTLSTKSLISWAAVMKLKDTLADCVNVSAQFVENINLFSVTMGKSANAAYDFAEKVNDALGVDTSDWVRYQGFFQSVGKGFGIASEKTDLMSQNLTQLSYDISSFYNLSADEAYNKVQSGFAGELEPLRRLGFALDEATLKQVAYNKGITQSYDTMTQAQKAQLRYVAMIEQAQNIGVTGDMSRTIDTASNGLRILSARLQQFARAVGNMLLPMLSAILPYLTAFVQLLTDAANKLAGVLGFELPKIELGGLSNGYDDVAAAADEATAATEKFKGSLAGVDQLNIIGSHTNSGGSGDDGYSTDLNIELPTYDFLNGVESKVKGIVEDMKAFFYELAPWLESFGAIVATAFGAVAIIKFRDALKNVVATITKLSASLGTSVAPVFWSVAGALAAGASSGILFFNSLKRLISGTGNVANNIAQLAGAITIAGTAITAFIVTGNPVGAIITGIAAAIGLVAGVISGINEKIEQQNEAVSNSILFNNGGTKITDVANAFDKLASAAQKANSETIEKYTALDEYNTKIADTLETIEGIAGTTDIDFSQITPADAESLKQPFEELTAYLNEDFQNRAQTAADDLLEIFSDLGIGDVVSEQVAQGYDRLQTLFDEDLTVNQQVISEYMDKIANGGALTDEEMKEFTERYNLNLDLANIENEEWQGLQKALDEFNELDLTKIDLENDETAIAALDNLEAAFTTYAASYTDRYNAEAANISVMQQKLDKLYNSGYSGMTEDEYNSAKELLSMSMSTFAGNYGAIMDETIRTLDAAYGTAENEIRAAAREQTGNFWDYTAATIAFGGGVSIGEAASSIAEARYLENSEILTKLEQMKSDLSDMRADVNLTLDGDERAQAMVNWVETGEPQYLDAFINVTTSYSSDLDNTLTPEQLAKNIVDEAISQNQVPSLRDFNYFDDGGYQKDIDNVMAALANGDLSVTVYNTVELDGEVISDATATRQGTMSFVTNGR